MQTPLLLKVLARVNFVSFLTGQLWLLPLNNTNVLAARKNIPTDLCCGDAKDDRPSLKCIFNSFCQYTIVRNFTPVFCPCVGFADARLPEAIIATELRNSSQIV